MIRVKEGPFMADHPSGELMGPSAPLEPNAGWEGWVACVVEAAAAGPVEAAELVSTAELFEGEAGE